MWNLSNYRCDPWFHRCTQLYFPNQFVANNISSRPYWRRQPDTTKSLIILSDCRGYTHIYNILCIRHPYKMKKQTPRNIQTEIKRSTQKCWKFNSYQKLVSFEYESWDTPPLNALSGFSVILTDSNIDNSIRQQCNDITQQNSDLLLKLIDDIVDLSSLERGKMQFKFGIHDAVFLCKNVIETVEKIKQQQL